MRRLLGNLSSSNTFKCSSSDAVDLIAIFLPQLVLQRIEVAPQRFDVVLQRCDAVQDGFLTLHYSLAHRNEVALQYLIHRGRCEAGFIVDVLPHGALVSFRESSFGLLGWAAIALLTDLELVIPIGRLLALLDAHWSTSAMRRARSAAATRSAAALFTAFFVTFVDA